MGAILQVLICTFGYEGIRRVARGNHPRVNGVEYLVSWQLPEGRPELPEELDRPDFRVMVSRSRGLSRNRNEALEASGAPLLLISDDDLDYSREGLEGVIRAFGDNPDCDLLTFRYESGDGDSHLPDFSFPLDHPAKGYYVISFSIAVRASEVRGKIRFNENFGIGGRLFPCGEEDLFVNDCLKSGLSGKYLPLTICCHEGKTTASRTDIATGIIEAKGAVMSAVHPLTWPLRMGMHLLRQCKPPSGPDGKKRRDGILPPLQYLKSWLAGVMKARRHKVFRTPHERHE